MKKLTLVFVVLLAAAFAFGQEPTLSPEQETSVGGQTIITDSPGTAPDPVRSEPDNQPPVSDSAGTCVPDSIRSQPETDSPKPAKQPVWETREGVEKATKAYYQEKDRCENRAGYYRQVIGNHGFSASDRRWAQGRLNTVLARLRKIDADIAHLRKEIQRLSGQVATHGKMLISQGKTIEGIQGDAKKTDGRVANLEKTVGDLAKKVGTAESNQTKWAGWRVSMNNWVIAFIILFAVIFLLMLLGFGLRPRSK